MGESGTAASVERGQHAILWDVDGVIIDSGEQHRLAWTAMAAERGLPYSDADFWATFGMRNQDIIPHVFGVSDAGEVDLAVLGGAAAGRQAAIAERRVAHRLDRCAGLCGDVGIVG